MATGYTGSSAARCALTRRATKRKNFFFYIRRSDLICAKNYIFAMSGIVERNSKVYHLCSDFLPDSRELYFDEKKIAEAFERFCNDPECPKIAIVTSNVLNILSESDKAMFSRLKLSQLENSNLADEFVVTNRKQDPYNYYKACIDRDGMQSDFSDLFKKITECVEKKDKNLEDEIVGLTRSIFDKSNHCRLWKYTLLDYSRSISKGRVKILDFISSVYKAKKIFETVSKQKRSERRSESRLEYRSMLHRFNISSGHDGSIPSSSAMSNRDVRDRNPGLLPPLSVNSPYRSEDYLEFKDPLVEPPYAHEVNPCSLFYNYPPFSPYQLSENMPGAGTEGDQSDLYDYRVGVSLPLKRPAFTSTWVGVASSGNRELEERAAVVDLPPITSYLERFKVPEALSSVTRSQTFD